MEAAGQPSHSSKDDYCRLTGIWKQVKMNQKTRYTGRRPKNSDNGAVKRGPVAVECRQRVKHTETDTMR